MGSQAELELEADKLLAENGAGRSAYPAYSEGYLRKREGYRRRVLAAAVELEPERLLRHPEVEPLFEIATCELLSGCRALHIPTSDQRLLRLRLLGLTYEEIANLCGCDTSTALRRVRRVAERLQTLPGFGWWSVYAREIRRSVHHVRQLWLQARERYR